MGRLIWFLFLMVFTSMNAFSQSYDELWKQYESALKKDLPRTQIGVLEDIIAKATKEKEYGHLIKAELANIQAVTSITPDSLAHEVAQLEKKVAKYEKKNPAAAAIYNSILGNIYRDSYVLNGEFPDKAKEYHEKAMRDVNMLATTKAGKFVPTIVEEADSKYFNDDLLHVLCYFIDDFATMHDYYDKVGNREAACLTALDLLKNKRRTKADRLASTSPLMHQVDSLITLYGDLDVSGELAIYKYNLMAEAEDVDAGQKVKFIDFAMQKWAAWPRIKDLQNSRNNLIKPMFSAEVGCSVVRPTEQRVVKLSDLRNLKFVRMTISKVDFRVEDEENFYLENEKTLEAVKKTIIEGTTNTITRQYSGHEEYDIFKDSIMLGELSKGVYLLEFETDNNDVGVARTLLFVSDVYVLREGLPYGETRFVVVSATTGKPLQKAKIQIKKGSKHAVLNCDKNGEVTSNVEELLENERDYRSPRIYAFTPDDKACPSQQYWRNYYSYSSPESVKSSYQLFTDRSIYRPGQTVNVSLVHFVVRNGINTSAVGGKTVDIRINDANGKRIGTQTVTTDEFGKASASFKIPESVMPGWFSINTTEGGRISVRVEEYKRPTFQVEMPEVTEKYTNGDTIKVKGYARTYAGVPVQGAEVRYTVIRRAAYWWWGQADTEELLVDTVKTDNDGAFEMTLPMVLPKDDEDEDVGLFGWRRNRFFDIAAYAVVTDQAGESHSGEMAVPLGDKDTAFGFSIPGKVMKGEMPAVTFNLRNQSGNPIDGEVVYYIDNDKKEYKAKANEPVKLPEDGPLAKTGSHSITAICMGDTVKREFILFSLNDKKPAVQTHDWFYATGSEFPKDGTPVTVQVGSSDPGTYVVYNVFSGDNVIEQGNFVLDNANRNMKWTYKEEYGNGIMVSYAWVRDGVLYTHRHSIRRPMPDKRILMKWETFRDRLTPGMEEEWTLKAEYPDGKPAYAQLMATLYDMSLDQIQKHWWSFNSNIGISLPWTSWTGMNYNDLLLSKSKFFFYINVPDLKFSHIDNSISGLWEPRVFAYGGRPYARAKNIQMLDAAPLPMAGESYAVADMASADEEYAAPPIKKDEVVEEAKEDGNDNTKEEPQLRENFNETAFYMPNVVTDDEGHFVLKFTLPESVTTWRFMGLATDKDINYGMTTAEAVAKKDVMVMPNMPRFIRTGDKATISARLANTTDHSIKGKATMTMLEPETQKVVSSQTIDFELEPNSTRGVSFDCVPDGTNNLLVCRIMAEGDGFSDGEQHMLPVLPDKELITRTMPFTQHGPGNTAISLEKLFPKGVDGAKLTVEYTNNPAWLMIQALPSMSADTRENAISLAMVYYANSLGKYIMGLSPEIKNTVEQWSKEPDGQNSLTSSLAKNPELRDILLNETPWVGAADKEESQKRSIANFFNNDRIDVQMKNAMDKLSKLQLSDGSWAWWEGMKGSPYITTAVSEMLVRLGKMTGSKKPFQRMLNSAFQFTDNYLKEEEVSLKEWEKKGHPSRPSETAINILYNYAIDQREIPEKMTGTVNYLVNLFEKRSKEFTIFGKARAAVVLAYYGRTERAAEYMQSIEEYSVATEEMGRYFDTRKAYYSWCSYNIPTEVAAIEAYKMLQPGNTQVVDEMRRWLLQQKRAQMWSSPINSVDAVYAFLEGNMKTLETGEMATLSIDGNTLQTSEATAGLGYVKTAVDAEGKKTFEASKTSQGTSWGALYAQFTQDIAEVENHSADLSVKREIIHDGEELKVGDKVVVRITVKAERDLDFVEVIDRRAACMEPVVQKSGYAGGYYIATKDYTTTFYFSRMAKGTHVMEKTYYIDREGTYQTGTCKVQCAYAPEYSATGKALNIVVKK